MTQLNFLKKGLNEKEYVLSFEKQAHKTKGEPFK